jgi:hypothetical protein
MKQVQDGTSARRLFLAVVHNPFAIARFGLFHGRIMRCIQDGPIQYRGPAAIDRGHQTQLKGFSPFSKKFVWWSLTGANCKIYKVAF